MKKINKSEAKKTDAKSAKPAIKSISLKDLKKVTGGNMCGGIHQNQR